MNITLKFKKCMETFDSIDTDRKMYKYEKNAIRENLSFIDYLCDLVIQLDVCCKYIKEHPEPTEFLSFYQINRLIENRLLMGIMSGLINCVNGKFTLNKDKIK